MGMPTPPPSDSEPDLPLRNASQGGGACGIHDLQALADGELTHRGSPEAGPRPPLPRRPAPRHHERRGTGDARTRHRSRLLATWDQRGRGGADGATRSPYPYEARAIGAVPSVADRLSRSSFRPATLPGAPTSRQILLRSAEFEARGIRQPACLHIREITVGLLPKHFPRTRPSPDGDLRQRDTVEPVRAPRQETTKNIRVFVAADEVVIAERILLSHKCPQGVLRAKCLRVDDTDRQHHDDCHGEDSAGHYSMIAPFQQRNYRVIDMAVYPQRKGS